MDIDGISKVVNGKYSIFYIDFFSDELKSIIRNQLQGVFHGFAEVETLPDYYSYKNTLNSFLDRYNSKGRSIKKGMIGELLAHILISSEFENISSLSILKNKEERSIKKGFDIIYCGKSDDRLWYSEVKSGNKSTADTCSLFNTELLGRAKRGIISMFDENRNSLWESALIDVNLMIKEGAGRISMKKLLSNDSPVSRTGVKKNVILISSLYNALTERIDEVSVSNFVDSIIIDDIFEDVIIISIQKNMFETVENFLKHELLTS